ncbi:MAG: dTDP-glucose 4,6-dehydratase [Treponema sp.]|nr:dTDP-glucose 4,6-dehydratase [Treponema sp.]
MRVLNNVLVTGGSGFIGTNFIRFLFNREQGVSGDGFQDKAPEAEFSGRVINLDSLSYAGNPANLSDIEAEYGGKRYFFIKGGIGDSGLLDSLFGDYGVDTVVHFAAESHVDRSILGPRVFIETNVLGTFNLLEAARKHWKDRSETRFHQISTDEVYGSLEESGAFTEDTAYAPRSPYSASKAAGDHLVYSYFHTYGLPVTLSNCSNNYGPFQFPEKFIPLMIQNILEGKALPVYGDGKNIRDWVHVYDHNRAVYLVLTCGKTGEKYNIGGENEWENRTLLDAIIKTVSQKAGREEASVRAAITYVKDRPGHDRRYAINCGKIKRELGWKRIMNFEAGLEQTVDWYLANQNWVKTIQSGEYLRWIENNYGSR